MKLVLEYILAPGNNLFFLIIYKMLTAIFMAGFNCFAQGIGKDKKINPPIQESNTL